MDLSIIIVSWNTRDLLKRCLDSIYQHTRGVHFEIFVIDNNSEDETKDMVEEYKSGNLYLIVNKTNRGFAAANNQGIKKAQGKYILLLNPDTKLKENSFAKMMEFMETQPLCGICGCHLLNSDASHQNSVRRFPKFLDQALILLKLHHLYDGFSSFKKYIAQGFNYQKSQMVDQVMGACFMIKRELVARIGLLDEKFFIWFEEVDYCKRAYNAGYEIWYYADTELTHHFRQSFKLVMPVKKQRIWNKSLRYYFWKHHGIVSYIGISILTWMGLMLAYGYGLFKSKK